MESRTKKITTAFVAGRSGGHIIPALTLAEALVQKNSAHHILFFSAATALDRKIVATSANIHAHITLAVGNIPYKNPFKWPLYVYQMIKATATSYRLLKKNKPECVISMGGYISLPVCLAAWSLKIPIDLFELNVEPGQATKFLAPLATRILTCFEETKQFLPSTKCQYQEYPVRFSLAQRTSTKQQACEQLSILPSKKVILVLGGSQGSLFINNYVKEWVKLSEDVQNLYFLHQIGEQDNAEQWQNWYGQHNIQAQVFVYNHDMALLYAAADLVICRSGAGTLFETVAFNKQCITIPLETASNNHQVANALAMQKKYKKLITVVRQHTIL